MNIDRLGTRMLLWFGVISQFKEKIVVLFNINKLVDVVGYLSMSFEFYCVFFPLNVLASKLIDLYAYLFKRFSRYVNDYLQPIISEILKG